jgi:hypothetical protein
LEERRWEVELIGWLQGAMYRIKQGMLKRERWRSVGLLLFPTKFLPFTLSEFWEKKPA